jgi:hypothetical protein
MKNLARRAWRLIAAAMEAVDWSLVILVAGFFGVILMGVVVAGDGTFLPTVVWSNPEHRAYEAAIAAAAVKHPAYAVPLETIAAATATVNVVTLGPKGTTPLKDRTFDMWVALPGELRPLCSGAVNPLRRLQQILGLPPVDDPERVVIELSVPRDGLFRPCVAGGDLAASACTMKFPDALPATADPTAVREAYARLQFVTAQMWNSYRVGFTDDRPSAAGAPAWGYPFTGMGWSYDWSNVPGHKGISEFVVKRDAAITVSGTPKTPAEFCAATPAK